jgi:hypothetical protein
MGFATEYQGWDVWVEKFKPINNHLDKYATPENPTKMFETYGEEVEFVQAQDPRYVWTNVQGDMSDLLVAGYAYVNRLGYYVTEIPWDDEYDTCLLSVEVECECYDENEPYSYTLPNGQVMSADADPNCKKCEGNGYITEYVGE